MASGIPTYRDCKGNWTASTPIKHQDYIANPAVRQRYWARSMVGWLNFGKAQPNTSHRALGAIEQLGTLSVLVTQNVDRLHQRGGSNNVVDLHGRLDQVECLDCGAQSERSVMQVRLEQANPGFQVSAATLRPDGDADIPDALIATVAVPACEECGGTLKPSVVFFGDNVPKARVHHCQEQLAASDALLVVGSSLQVYSGFRFCRQAAEQGTPIYIVNPGATRADSLAELKTSSSAEQVLQAWQAALEQQ